MELLKMNIKKTQGLQPADAGKYKALKKKVAALKDSIRREEIKNAQKITSKKV